MPSVQYKWRSEDTKVLPIDTDVGRVVAAELGSSVVHVEDQHLELNKQTSHVTVRLIVFMLQLRQPTGRTTVQATTSFGASERATLV